MSVRNIFCLRIIWFNTAEFIYWTGEAETFDKKKQITRNVGPMNRGVSGAHNRRQEIQRWANRKIEARGKKDIGAHLNRMHVEGRAAEAVVGVWAQLSSTSFHLFGRFSTFTPWFLQNSLIRPPPISLLDLVVQSLYSCLLVRGRNKITKSKF